MFSLQLPKNNTEAEVEIYFNAKAINDERVIMVVEDDADSRLMLKIMLEMWKYQVVEAIDGNDAINKAKQTNPDLILMDVGLPDMDGFDATKRIREFAPLDKMPIIYLSGYPRSHAKDVGGNGYLVKPVDVKELENIINIYIKTDN